ncbi:MAG TPA: UbiH/UbiF/VisC/COQ6 family ubiquinone biosynthesis hydroxylase [Micavibrio sp.]|jgi:2-octaprenyl-6-methoxyphenol hydroxylase
MTTPRNAPKKSCDVIIIGGGLSGGTLAALLGTHGFHVVCIDRDPPLTHLGESFDGRTTAVSWGSQKILASAGVWPALEKEACPIRRIDILDGGSPALLRFASDEVEDQSFGWIIENRLIRKALFDRMASLKTVAHLAPAIISSLDRNDDRMRATLQDGTELQAPLVVGADGRGSFTREWAGIGTRGWLYRQRAVVCTVIHEKPHDNVAVEHFRAQGPFAILPMTDGPGGEYRSSVVWTEHGPERQSAIHYSQTSFDAALTARFPDGYGAVRQTGKRFAYPLGLQHAHNYTAPRIALVAEAAHGIHPIAGQGLNMGFRDLKTLDEELCRVRDARGDFGGPDLLSAYERRRRIDNMGMAAATDSLNKLFSNSLPVLPLVRKAGLKMVARIPAAKRFFMHQAMGRQKR